MSYSYLLRLPFGISMTTLSSFTAGDIIRPARREVVSGAVRRTALTIIPALVVWLFAAAPAFAAKTGEGLVGETNDKVITFFSLGLLLFFVLFVVFASTAQGRLERRAEARKAARARQRVG